MRITPATLLRDVVVLATLGSLAVAGARVTWHLLGHSGAMAALPAPAAAAPEVAPPDIGPILALGPFGDRAVPAPEAGPAPETSLDLVLRGVVVRPRPADSSALISAEGATRTFRPGDAVTERATLVAVEAAQVVLDVDGERQTLSFPEPGGGPSGEAAAPGSGVDRLRAAINGQGGSEARGDDEDDGPVTPDDFIALWRERIRANPAEVLDSIGLIATENGYMIAPEHDSGVARAGLRAGDVVRSVNGQALGDIERDRELYDDVAASGQARIEVERDGRTIVMSFPLR